MLEKKKASIGEERAARKEPLADADVKKLLASVSKVVISKGKKSVTLDADETKPANLKGPTGSYRAPMVRKGKTLLVGFSESALSELLE